jgi:threonine dehydratase
VRRVRLELIERAAATIDPVFRQTPQFVSETLSAELGCRVVCKIETLNPLRCFKGRGTDFFVQSLVGKTERLICASAGNFGQGMAYAARKAGRKLEIFAAENANPLKVERMRALGAEVRLRGSDFDAAKQAAREHAEKTGGRFVEDGREPEVAEGAGTIGVELLHFVETLDAVVLPLGNGALLAGIGHWVKSKTPQTQVYGVCAAGAPAMEHSWRSGTLTSTESAATIADGIAVRVPVPEALEELKGVVDDILLVSEEQILAAMRLAYAHLGLVVEPAGAAGLAAVAAEPDRFAGRTVAVPFCGGNVTAEQARMWFGQGAE